MVAAKMPKIEKVKVNVKERVEDNVCDLSLSELTEVPVREIASFKRVTVLDLSSNRLTTLGKNFTCLTRLTKLDLSKNQIKFLPEDFGLLRNLRHLDLYDNKLEHLPLSLGSITSLRYLDLKGNPLTPALVKIVGHCLTTKDCQNSARNTVKFLAHMQLEAEKAKQKYQEENMTAEQQEEEEAAAAAEEKAKQDENDSAKNNNKKAGKKTKSKSKKSNNQNNHNEVVVAPSKSETKTAKANKKSNNKSNKSGKSSTTALTSIFVFFLLLAINVLLIYMITYKNPEFADKVVAYIPPHYRAWILTKAEFFRLSVSDWLANFSTPPEDGD